MDSMEALYKGEAGRAAIKAGLQKTVKRYDYKKAKQMILDNSPAEAGLYMSGDRSYTYKTIWEDGKFLINLDEEPEIAGIKESVWATPMLEMDDKEYECYTEVEVNK